MHAAGVGAVEPRSFEHLGAAMHVGDALCVFFVRKGSEFEIVEYVVHHICYAANILNDFREEKSSELLRFAEVAVAVDDL